MSAGGPFPVAGEWEESGSGNRRADSSRGRAGAHLEGAGATDLHVSHSNWDIDDEHTAFLPERRTTSLILPACSCRLGLVNVRQSQSLRPARICVGPTAAGDSY